LLPLAKAYPPPAISSVMTPTSAAGVKRPKSRLVLPAAGVASSPALREGTASGGSSGPAGPGGCGVEFGFIVVS
jgi:hypothetical protein